jgi:hypothetical protein
VAWQIPADFSDQPCGQALHVVGAEDRRDAERRGMNFAELATNLAKLHSSYHEKTRRGRIEKSDAGRNERERGREKEREENERERERLG